MAKIPIKLWLKLNDPEYEIFRRSSHMFNDFVAEVKAPPTGIVIEKLIKLDETLQNVIDLIQNLIKSLKNSQTRDLDQSASLFYFRYSLQKAKTC